MAIARRAAAIPLALAWDALLGELPNRAHPVAWLGTLLDRFSRRMPRRPALPALAAGALTELLALSTAWVFGGGTERLLRQLPGPLALALEAYALKQALALRALVEAGEAVAAALERDELDAARAALRSLVSRDRELPAALVAAAAVESVAENGCDSVVGPLLAYALGGLPAAWLYRSVNTADAMFGYRGEYEQFGTFPARVDDLVNLVPARATCLALLGAALLLGRDARRGWRVARRDRRRTASPNAGWSMAAMAGLLNVELEKRGSYRLHAGAPLPSVEAIRAANRIVTYASWGTGLFLSAVLIGVRLTVMRDRPRGT